jgi:hypothetical protein
MIVSLKALGSKETVSHISMMRAIPINFIINIQCCFAPLFNICPEHKLQFCPISKARRGGDLFAIFNLNLKN